MTHLPTARRRFTNLSARRNRDTTNTRRDVVQTGNQVPPTPTPGGNLGAQASQTPCQVLIHAWTPGSRALKAAQALS